MDYINIIIQGIIQGLTEFLPVSSSGHLSLTQHFLNIQESNLLIMVCLHMGTLIAVFIAFRKTIWEMIKELFLTIKDISTGKFSWKNMNDSRRMMMMVVISTLLLIPVYFVKDYFTDFEGDGDIIFEGCAFLFTALLLFFADACTKGMKTGKDMRITDAIRIGILQIIAILPGVSRSGSTITGGLLCGLSAETAVAFSFILGIPAILGGSVVELKETLSSGVNIDITVLAIGFAVAAVVGFLSIKLVELVGKKRKFKIFAVYMILLGVATISTGIYENVTGARLFING